eukprot:5379-Heterococcus_DN1.PRE.1
MLTAAIDTATAAGHNAAASADRLGRAGPLDNRHATWHRGHTHYTVSNSAVEWCCHSDHTSEAQLRRRCQRHRHVLCITGAYSSSG